MTTRRKNGLRTHPPIGCLWAAPLALALVANNAGAAALTKGQVQMARQRARILKARAARVLRRVERGGQAHDYHVDRRGGRVSVTTVLGDATVVTAMRAPDGGIDGRVQRISGNQKIVVDLPPFGRFASKALSTRGELARDAVHQIVWVSNGHAPAPRSYPERSEERLRQVFRSWYNGSWTETTVTDRSGRERSYRPNDDPAP